MMTKAKISSFSHFFVAKQSGGHLCGSCLCVLPMFLMSDCHCTGIPNIVLLHYGYSDFARGSQIGAVVLGACQ